MSRAGLGQGSVMSRRAVLALAPGLVALGATRALAQRSPGPARIGWLGYVSPPDAGLENLRLGLQELGHAEGKSFVLIPRFANGDFTRLPGLVDELMTERLDVLASRGPSVDYLKTARARVPVVFAYSGDPVAAGFADSLAKPGRNMTGITFMALELSSKRIELLKELVPPPRRWRCCRTRSTQASWPSTGSPRKRPAGWAPPSRAIWPGARRSCPRSWRRSARAVRGR